MYSLHIHTYTHNYIHMHTHTHTHIVHPHVHPHVHWDMHTRTPTYTPKRQPTCTPTRMHTHTHTLWHIATLTHLAHVHPRVQPQVITRSQVHGYTYSHVRRHMFRSTVRRSTSCWRTRCWSTGTLIEILRSASLSWACCSSSSVAWPLRELGSATGATTTNEEKTDENQWSIDWFIHCLIYPLLDWSVD